MDQIVHIERGDPDEEQDLTLALAIGRALEKAYPNHYWLVSFVGHNLIIRHLLIANFVTLMTGKEGFASLLPRDKIGTVHEAEKTAVKFAGALLEAFGLPRGPWNGDDLPQMPPKLLAEVRAGRQLRGWGNGK